MVSKEKMRQADLVTAVVLLIVGIAIIAHALTMPMEGAYGGVATYWYVSPALFPLIIGGMIIILCIVLAVNAVREKAHSQLLQIIKNYRSNRNISFSEKFKSSASRVLIVIAYISGFVYLYIPRTDFFLNVLLFLVIFIGTFYPDSKRIMSIGAMLASSFALLFIMLIVTGAADFLNNIFPYSMDVFVLIQVAAITIIFHKLIQQHQPERAQKLFTVILVTSFTVPLVLVPLFRYGLRIPLPVEGGIISIFNLVYYLLR